MKPYIVDCTLFFKEFDVFDLRLGTLYDHVEKFFVFESDITFSGKEKPFHFIENQNQFFDPDGKITCVKVNRRHLKQNDPWKEEEDQRNYMWFSSCGYGNNDNVFILMSDVDEIPNPKQFSCLRSGVINIFEQKIFYYTINNKIKNLPWLGTRAVDIPTLLRKSPQECRNERGGNIIKNGGWHFSYLGDSDFMKEKVEAFSHQEYNNDHHKNLIEERVLNNQDLFGRNEIEFEKEEINSDNYSQYMLDNMDKLWKKSLVY